MKTGNTCREEYVAAWRRICRAYGYAEYRTGRFEEYDFYAENRDFLPGGRLITFTGESGRLMALKPDVTLSVLKNATPPKSGCRKLFYNESVYRVSPRSGEFCEIAQCGLECIGDVDLYAIGEVLTVACDCLDAAGRAFVLDLSHMGFVSALLAYATGNVATQRELLALVRMRSAHGIRECCQKHGIPEAASAAIAALPELNGEPEKVLSSARAVAPSEDALAALDELEAVCRIPEATGCCGTTGRLRIDFSVVNDMSYYNGVIFRGYADGVPECVLAGGRYDGLAKKLGLECGAVGFAVELDALERIFDVDDGYDCDLLLLTDGTEDVAALSSVVRREIAAGRSVILRKSDCGDVRYREKRRINADGKEGLKYEF